jgi:hypothetical protein
MEPEPEPEPEPYIPISVEHMKPSAGTFFYEIMGTLVLLKKHKNISYPFDLEVLRNPQFFSWNGVRLVTHNYKAALHQCLEDEGDISFILLRVGDSGGHLNTILFFKQIKTIFRFEPEGFNVGSFNPNELDLDLELEREFIYLSDWKYVKHSDIGTSCMGCQGLEKKEVMLREKHDPGGFCASWNFWMIEYILRNQDMITSQDDLSNIYIHSCGELNPGFDPDRTPLKVLIRDYNISLLRECIEYLYFFLPLFSHSQKRELTNIDKGYSSYVKSDSFEQWMNESYHNMILKIIYEAHDILYKIAMQREQFILTIHGYDLDLCNEIMVEMDSGYERPRKVLRGTLKHNKSEKPKNTKRQPKPKNTKRKPKPKNTKRKPKPKKPKKPKNTKRKKEPKKSKMR